MMEDNKKDALKKNITDTVIESTKEHTEQTISVLKEKIKTEKHIGKKILYIVGLVAAASLGAVVSTNGGDIVNYIFSLF